MTPPTVLNQLGSSLRTTNFTRCQKAVRQEWQIILKQIHICSIFKIFTLSQKAVIRPKLCLSLNQIGTELRLTLNQIWSILLTLLKRAKTLKWRRRQRPNQTVSISLRLNLVERQLEQNGTWCLNIKEHLSVTFYTILKACKPKRLVIQIK